MNFVVKSPWKEVAVTLPSALRLACLCSIFMLGACAARGPLQQEAQTPPTAQSAAASDHASSIDSAFPTLAAATNENSRALQNFWISRVESSNTEPSSDYTLGPGDVLRIFLPQVEKAQDSVVRVSQEDTISLPLLGVIS